MSSFFFFNLKCNFCFSYGQETVGVITCDGRVIVGQLRGYDQLQNLILCNCHERVFSTDAPVELVPLGLYVIRGDNIVLIHEIDESLDAKIDLNTLRAKPLRHVTQYIL
jgi:U6 snRNA-associated Sm-like protein LSm8